jgi:hypothetical protein
VTDTRSIDDSALAGLGHPSRHNDVARTVSATPGTDDPRLTTAIERRAIFDDLERVTHLDAMAVARPCRCDPGEVTSNRKPVEWLRLMADPLLAQSAIDRPQSAAHELVLDSESYRQRQKPAVTTSNDDKSLDPAPTARRSSRRRR